MQVLKAVPLIFGVAVTIASMLIAGLAVPTYGQEEIVCFKHDGPKDLACFGVPSVGDVLNVIWDPGEFAGPVVGVAVNSVTIRVVSNSGSPFNENKNHTFSVGVVPTDTPTPTDTFTPTDTEPSPTCFTGETLILTPDGYQRIDHLTVGDAVLSYDHATGEFVESPVATLFSKEVAGYLLVTLANGKEIRVTESHPFYDPHTDTYRAINSFHPGDMLAQASPDGLSDVRIVSIEPVNEPVAVYNLHVANENHNYLAAGVLVHNKTPTPTPPPPNNGIGGVAVDPNLRGLPLETPGSSGSSAGMVASVIALAAGTLMLGSAVWYDWRRRPR